jgi:hypothetical protein
VYATVAHVHAIDDGIAYRRAALDNPPAHDGNMATETMETRKSHYGLKGSRLNPIVTSDKGPITDFSTPSVSAQSGLSTTLKAGYHD